MKPYTIRLKHQFKDYDAFETQLEPFLENKNILDIRTFNVLMNLYGSAFLIYNTKERNNAHIGMVYEKEYFIFKKQKEFYDLELNKLTELQTNIENKLYTTNSITDNVEDSYLDGRSTSTQNTNLSLLNQLAQVKEHINSLISPYQEFIARVKNKIMLPIQPNSGKIETGGSYINITKGSGYGK